ncbi:MAG: FAD:protein FMN transferase [Campylobacterota bacterium]|nr:FAD:protein FMN transferase [Campylobacterota bacterium]
MKKIISIISIVLLFLVEALHAEVLTTRTQMHMGTLVSLSLESSAMNHSQPAFNLINDIEMALSSYNPHAEIYKLNHGQRLNVSSYTKEALLLSQRYYKESDGYFNITVGSITKKAYGFGETEKIPTDKEFQDALIKIDGIHIADNYVSLEENITIDLGGMGKGYAVDKVADYLFEQNITEGVIAASGDIRCLNICTLQIQDPFQEGSVASFKTKIPNLAISTSGNYRRYIKSKKYNHLIDPKQKRSQQQFASITLVAQIPNSDLDAYATAASVMPFKNALQFLEERKLEYILITTDKKLLKSTNLNHWVEMSGELHL